MTNEAVSTTAYRILFHDGWDAHTHFPVTDNSYGVLALQANAVFDADAFRPTRTIDWDKERGIAEIELAYSWDPSSAQWSDIHQVSVQTSDPWTDLNYHYDRLSDASIGVAAYGPATAFPPGSKDRVEQTAYRPLDSWYVLGDWTHRSFLENGSSRLPSIDRTSIPSNGATLSETTGGAITKQFTYASDNSGMPTQFKLSGTGLIGSGSVGFSYGYDTTYNLVSVRSLSPMLQTTRTLDALGDVTSVTDANSITERYGWDTLGRITQITPAGSELPTYFGYADDFRSMTISRGSAQRSSFYNAFGELIRETRLNPDGSMNHRNRGYDATGRMIWQTIWEPGPGSDACWSNLTPPLLADGSGPVPASYTTYDYRGRVVRRTAPTGEVTSITYSGLDRSVTENPDGAVASTTIFHSDFLGRLIGVTDALNQSTTYSYDTADRLIQVIQVDPLTQATQSRTWDYDLLGRLVKITQPESGVTTYGALTVDGKPTITVFGAGSTAPMKVTTSYDGLGRILSVVSDDGTVNQSYSYDQLGHGASLGKLSSASSNGIDKSLSYGGLNGRLSSLTRSVDGQTFTQQFGYDNLGHIITRTYPDGRVQTLTFDPMRDLPSSSSFNGANVGTFSYDQSSWLLTGLTADNNASSVFGYTNERLSSIAHFIPGMTLANWSLRYDAFGDLTSDGEDFYTYDSLHRLTRSFIRDPLANPMSEGLSQSVAYDAFGNRSGVLTQRVTNWTGPSVPSLPALEPLSTSDKRGLPSFAMSSSEKTTMALSNHLPASAGGVPTGAIYDPQGNLTQIFKIPGTSSSQLTMTYDALGRVITLADASHPGVQEKYFYDDQGLRTVVEIWQNGSLQKREFNIYNEARQLVAQYEWVLQ
ncbi:MAG TPA: hypothetical protein VFT74_00535 [Isosphaeraceae bacterium]|nr:hypothetical protein [Isosphaeraceae bacterium]